MSVLCFSKTFSATLNIVYLFSPVKGHSYAALKGRHLPAPIFVNPAYSSVIGNFEYGNENTPDSIAASIEIARRAHKKFQTGWLIPAFNIHCLDEQWKQTLGKVGSWKALSNKIKKLGLKYRFLLLDYLQNAVFSKSYTKSQLDLLCFLIALYSFCILPRRNGNGGFPCACRPEC